MILHNLKKLNDPKLWDCYKVGYAADDGVTIVDAGEAYYRKRKIKNRLDLSVEQWRLLALSYLKASIAAHSGGHWPQYAFSDQTIVTYPEAIGLLETKSELWKQIVERNKTHVIRLIDEISRELGEMCEVDSKS